MVMVQVDLVLRDGDMLELDREARNLAAELRLLGLDATRPAQTMALTPQGAKGAAASEAGTLLVTVANSAVLVAVCQAVGTWLSRSDRSSRSKVTITVGDRKLEVTGADERERQRIVEQFFGELDAQKDASPAAGIEPRQPVRRLRRLLGQGKERG